jgi:hypothetical protein
MNSEQPLEVFYQNQKEVYRASYLGGFVDQRKE